MGVILLCFTEKTGWRQANPAVFSVNCDPAELLGSTESHTEHRCRPAGGIQAIKPANSESGQRNEQVLAGGFCLAL